MDLIIKCEKCDGIAKFSPYFGAYMCKCGWKDDSYDKDRVKKESLLSFGKISTIELTQNEEILIGISSDNNEQHTKKRD